MRQLTPAPTPAVCILGAAFFYKFFWVVIHINQFETEVRHVVAGEGPGSGRGPGQGQQDQTASQDRSGCFARAFHCPTPLPCPPLSSTGRHSPPPAAPHQRSPEAGELGLLQLLYLSTSPPGTVGVKSANYRLGKITNNVSIYCFNCFMRAAVFRPARADGRPGSPACRPGPAWPGWTCGGRPRCARRSPAPRRSPCWPCRRGSKGPPGPRPG